MTTMQGCYVTPLLRAAEDRDALACACNATVHEDTFCPLLARNSTREVCLQPQVIAVTVFRDSIARVPPDRLLTLSSLNSVRPII